MNENRNRYAVIGVNKKGQDIWFLRFNLGTPLEDMTNYAMQFIDNYSKMGVWLVDYKDEKIEKVWSSDEK